MNYKMSINTYLSTIESISKKKTKQSSRTWTELWLRRAFQWLPDGTGVWENG